MQETASETCIEVVNSAARNSYGGDGAKTEFFKHWAYIMSHICGRSLSYEMMLRSLTQPKQGLLPDPIRINPWLQQSMLILLSSGYSIHGSLVSFSVAMLSTSSASADFSPSHAK